MKSIKSKLILFLFETRLYNWFVKNILPHIYLRKKNNLDANRIYLGIDKALSEYLNQSVKSARGIVIGSRDPSKLSGKLIPGDVDHVGILDCGYVIEAVAEGVVKTTLEEFISRSEGVILCYGYKWDKEYRNNIANIANTFIGIGYDRKFKFGTEALYCSELVFESDIEGRCSYDSSDLAGIGRDYISPIGIVEAVGMTRIYDSRCFEGND